MRIFRDVLLFSWSISGGAARLLAVRDTVIIPSPLVIAPSQNWDGVDGQWSSFGLRVGQPAQDVRVLVSTNSPATMVVLPQGCTTQAMDPVSADCSNSRGGYFTTNYSTTWNYQGRFGINQNGVGFEANLGYTQPGDYGLDDLGLGYASDGPTLKNQTVMGFGTASPFYLGMFGLGTQPVNYSTIGNFSAPSFFTSLKSQAKIPSLSWSYTAGAQYRLKAGQLAQLIFGGYDQSRFASNTASFSMALDIDRDLVVAIQSITYTGGTTQQPMLGSPIYAFIESTDPNIWLPKEACQKFEEAFGISIDNNTGLYLINSTHYNDLKVADPHVTFTLANSLNGGDTVNIELPFSAFALQASYPFTPESTIYFPLRQAANDSQNTLGRVFLQEAYLTADYENKNFSVSQCTWNDGAKSQIVSIVSSDYASTPSNTTSVPPISKDASTEKHVSGGVIAAAVLASLIGILGIAALVLFLLRNRKRRSVSKLPTENATLSSVAPFSSSVTDKDGFNEGDLYSPAPVYRKYGNHPFHGQYVPSADDGPRVELPVPGGEIYQLSDSDNNSDSRALRAANTPEVPGCSPPLYELPGCDPIELDDVESRSGLLPSTGPRTPVNPGALDPAGASPRVPSPPSPLSPFSDFMSPIYE